MSKEAKIYINHGTALLKKTETTYLGEVSDKYIDNLEKELKEQGYEVIIYEDMASK